MHPRTANNFASSTSSPHPNQSTSFTGHASATRLHIVDPLINPEICPRLTHSSGVFTFANDHVLHLNFSIRFISSVFLEFSFRFQPMVGTNSVMSSSRTTSQPGGSPRSQIERETTEIRILRDEIRRNQICVREKQDERVRMQRQVEILTLEINSLIHHTQAKEGTLEARERTLEFLNREASVLNQSKPPSSHGDSEEPELNAPTGKDASVDHNINMTGAPENLQKTRVEPSTTPSTEICRLSGENDRVRGQSSRDALVTKSSGPRPPADDIGQLPTQNVRQFEGTFIQFMRLNLFAERTKRQKQ